MTLVIDTSVFIAIFGNEPEARALSDRMAKAQRMIMSAGNYLEAGILAETRLGGRTDLDGWLEERGVEVQPVSAEVAKVAVDTFARYGKGRHAAALNYGDCFAYALARHLRAPLLFQGDDFSRTDIEPALV